MISVCIIAKNEEKNIERCLRSVSWADEIILIDAESNDRTCELAKALGAKVLVKRWEGYSVQKEFAVNQAVHEWVLAVDADEEVTEKLMLEIQNILKNQPPIKGFEIPRKSFFLGKWIRYGGWYPGYQLRLFRKLSVRMNHRPVHEGFQIDGEVGKLESDINHYSYDSLHHYLEKMNDYSSLDVANKLKKTEKVFWYNFVLNPLSSFLRTYFSLQGYKDGIHGFLLSLYSALHVLVIYCKVWEYQQAQLSNSILPPVSSEDINRLKFQ